MTIRSALTGFLMLVLLCTIDAELVRANSTTGAWSLGPLLPIAPINMLVLPNGKVMFYPGNTISGDDPYAWDPGTGQITNLAKAGYDLFCTGHSSMRNGTILFPGGNLTTPFFGLPYVSTYNPATNTWVRGPDMNDARWYPSTTTMQLGQVLVMTGMIDSTQLENPLPQVWEPWSGTWRNLTNAMLKIYNYSWVFLAPFGWGTAIVAGPERQTRILDTNGTGAWTQPTSFNYPNIRDYGSAVMYDPWAILIAGGGTPPTNTAEVLNLSNPSSLSPPVRWRSRAAT